MARSDVPFGFPDDSFIWDEFFKRGSDVTPGGLVPVTAGGTGIASYSIGDLLYASATTTLSKLAIGTTDYVLTVVGGLPSWATPEVTVGAAPAVSLPTNLLKFDGSDGSTTITDSGSSPATWTSTGAGCEIDTAQSKFGGSSLMFDNSGELFDNTTNFTLNRTGNWTVDFWWRAVTVANKDIGMVFMDDTGSGGTINLDFYGTLDNKLHLDLGSTGSGAGTSDIASDVTGTKTSWSADTWYHIAIVRDLSAGKYYVYVDGVKDIEVTSSTNVGTTQYALPLYYSIGAGDDTRWLEEFRIFDTCLYPNGTTFIPPTEGTDVGDVYVMLAADATGIQTALSDSGLVFNTSTNTLTADTFVGALEGNADTVTWANEATDTTCFIAFGTAASGSLPVKTNANMTFNSSTGVATFGQTVVGSISGNAGTVTVADAGGDTTTFPLLGTSATGSLSPATDAGLTYNATTNALTTTTFIGALTGNASTATALQNARTIGGVSFDGTANIVPTTIVVADTTDSTCFVGLFESATGDLLPKTDGALTYDATTGTLTASVFSGASSTVSVADTTDSTCFVALFESATGNLAAKTDAGFLYNASAGALSLPTNGSSAGISIGSTPIQWYYDSGTGWSRTVANGGAAYGITSANFGWTNSGDPSTDNLVLFSSSGPTVYISGATPSITFQDASHVAYTQITGNSATQNVEFADGIYVTTNIQLGHASDTTLSRLSAGVLGVEGVTVATASNTLTFTNKALTSPDIDGGTIDNAVIGGNTPAAITGTALYANTSLVVSPESSSLVATAGSLAPLTQLNSTGANGSSILLSRWVASAGASPRITGAKSRGAAVGTHGTAMTNGEDLFSIVAEGSDGTNFVRASEFLFEADAAASSGIVPGRVAVRTANSSGTMTDAMSWNSSQRTTTAAQVGIGTSAIAGTALEIGSTQTGVTQRGVNVETTFSGATTNVNAYRSRIILGDTGSDITYDDVVAFNLGATTKNRSTDTVNKYTAVRAAQVTIAALNIGFESTFNASSDTRYACYYSGTAPAYINGELRLGTTTGGTDAMRIGDAKNIAFDTTTGTKIGTATSQKIGFWNATPIVQPTTSVTAATFVANTSGIADDTATFDGYTIGKVVKALRNIGLLA